jgi:hypothetical protein
VWEVYLEYDALYLASVTANRPDVFSPYDAMSSTSCPPQLREEFLQVTQEVGDVFIKL